ncbi:unnamed protein product [Phytophthora fragariaefolia]|uniref:Unnamed protein product n=1 Tax=Phytophthora fragariaefolia TaxID=1490495 RepID=A0A9W6YCE2_9STRA|nr:unnamed protein product [Phytophthora fragariaefolia]
MNARWRRDDSAGGRRRVRPRSIVYPALLEPREGYPPVTTLGVEHEVHTGTEAPIKVGPRRHALEQQRVIEENKKYGSIRFCIDYRMLNAITKKDVYPLSRIDDTLDHLHGARRFTTLDLHSGYRQVPVAKKDRDKTGFVTRRGLFRFVRMPFGLANTPGTFQRMMDAVLRGLMWQTCLVYLDDVIIFTKGDMTQHVVELTMVLERLARAGLSLKAKKCTFAAERLEYFGHELGEDGVRPMESLIKSVQKFPVPQDADAVKRFVHIAGYYRRFSAFEGLKKALTERPLLAYPHFTRPFRLVTDASAVGLGATLTQDQGNGEQPIAYASRINSETVARYGISELECAAVIWAVKLFRPYLYGRRSQLVTDHSALKWLMTSTTLSVKLHRWALQLQEYDFEVKYRPGADNVVADALSRAPVNAVTAAGQNGGDTTAQPRREEVQQSQGGLQGDVVGGAQRENGSETTGNVDQLTDAVI